jgi:hypothetical protein
MKKNIDIIEQISKEANTHNRVVSIKSAEDREYRARHFLGKKREEMRILWNSAVKFAKRVFSKEFGHPPGVSFEWVSNYSEINYRKDYKGKTHLWLRYRVLYEGLEILRDFEPLCKEDILAETWKLWAVLDQWKKFLPKEER